MDSGIFLKIYRLLYGRFGPQDWWPAKGPFEVMVGAVLTQNTAWTNVEKAIANLRKESLLSPGRLDRISPRRLARLITPVGYYNIKAKRLKNLVGFLSDEFGGNISLMRRRDLKALRPKLLAVNGVGPETCDSILLYALDKPIFVIDAYTKRVFSRFGLAAEDISYNDLQQVFMRHLPRNTGLYNEYHALIVRLGKEICRKEPRCRICPIDKMCYNSRKRRDRNG